jgi:hypothetical protein
MFGYQRRVVVVVIVVRAVATVSVGVSFDIIAN